MAVGLTKIQKGVQNPRDEDDENLKMEQGQKTISTTNLEFPGARRIIPM